MGKKLTYVVAFSADGAADVTRRYVVNPAENATRRDQCDEAWLARELRDITARSRRETDAERRAELTARDESEAEELSAVDDETRPLPGRQTGSLEWRAARGELGERAAATDVDADASGGTNSEPNAKRETEPKPEPEALAAAASRLSVRANAEPETQTATAAVEAGKVNAATSEGVGADDVRAAVHAEFARLMREGGATPNEAAAKALVNVRRSMRETAASTRG